MVVYVLLLCMLLLEVKVINYKWDVVLVIEYVKIINKINLSE